MELTLKNLIAEGKQIQAIEVEPEIKKKTVSTLAEIEVVLENDSDVVLRRKTKTTSKLLIMILSQGLIYIKDEKNGETTPVDKISQIIKFFNDSRYSVCSFQQLRYRIWQLGYASMRPTNFVKYAVSNKEDIKFWVNHKIFLTMDDSFIEFIKKGRETNPKFNEDIVWCYDFVQNFPAWTKNLEPKLKKCYTFLRVAEGLGVTRDKIMYNLDNLIGGAAIFVPNFLDDGTIGRIEGCLKQVDFNRFCKYMLDLVQIEGLHGNRYQSVGSFHLDDYIDYLDMQVQMYGKVKEKYLTNWLTEHHKIITTYNAWKQLHKEDIMFNLSQKIKSLEYSKGEFSIVVPTTTTEIVDEGFHLGHCVASYVNSILKGSTNIVFLRKTKELDKSWVTVEVRDGKIAQARGCGNRYCDLIEYKFLKEWGEKNRLDISYCEKGLNQWQNEN